MQSRLQILVNFKLFELQEALNLFSPCRVVKATGRNADHLAAELTCTACIEGYANNYY